MPMTQECPFCHELCVKPPTNVLGQDVKRVKCGNCSPYYPTWCWLCRREWVSYFNWDCGNPNCGQSVTTLAVYSKNKQRPVQGDSKKSTSLGLVGLCNLGNTCFMNSALQCMLQCPGFVDEFLSGSLSTKKKRGAMISAWTALVKNVYSESAQSRSGGRSYGFGSSDSISPTEIKWALNAVDDRIGTGRQEDAFFVIIALLDGLDQELTKNDDTIQRRERYAPGDRSPSKRKIADIAEELWQSYNDTVAREYFEGVAVETLTCPECGYAQMKYEEFRHVELPFVDKEITLNVKVYAAAIKKVDSPGLVQLKLAFDNTLDGLRYLLLSHDTVQQLLSHIGADRDAVTVQFGCISRKDVKNCAAGEWITYYDDDNFKDCSSIDGDGEFFAVLSVCEDDVMIVPAQNLIINEHGKPVADIMDTLSFLALRSEAVRVKDVLPKIKKFKSALFYDGRVQRADESLYISDASSCLLRVWVSMQYSKPSPADSATINLEFDKQDRNIICLATSHLIASKKKRTPEIKDITAALKQYEKLNYVDLTDLLPNYGRKQKDEDCRYCDEIKGAARKTRQKMEAMAIAVQQSTDLFREWFKQQLIGKKRGYLKDAGNDTKPKVIDNLIDGLAAYEEAETSDAYGLVCRGRCDDIPAVVQRKFELIRAPQILLIHIDRDADEDEDDEKSYGWMGWSLPKSDRLIDYPIHKPLEFKDAQYDLFGVVAHHGRTIAAGHYVAHVKSKVNESWYEMNDGARRRKLGHVKANKNATVLLYSKR